MRTRKNENEDDQPNHKRNALPRKSNHKNAENIGMKAQSKEKNTKTIAPRIEFKFLNNNLSNLLLLIIFYTYLFVCVD